ncbi:MAG TPA: tetratricopeptide repeat protein [Kofleriaceae bacterium]
MEIARGTIAERPWAITLAAFARRGVSGQITLLAGDKRHVIAFERGTIVGARSPMTADSAARVALTSHLANPAHISELHRQLALMPGRDEVDVLAEIARLTRPQVSCLRTDTIIRRAARTFAVDAGEYIFEDRACLPGRAGDVDIRAVIYHGIRMHLSEQRLTNDLRQLGGTRFVLEPQAADELNQFGFCEGEWPILAMLRDGASLPELEARHREVDPRTMQAAILALVACGTARVVAVARVPTAPNIPRTKTNPELAAEAAERAQRALEVEQVETAVIELRKAVELVPNDVDYGALLGWALFCAAQDKRAAAEETKRALERALNRSTKPELARFYLGRVERMLGRDREALHHFHAVLLLDPTHRDASAEIRVLQARLRQQRSN